MVLVAVQPLLQGLWPWRSDLVLEGPSVLKQLFQITVLRGENASAKTLQSVVKSLESDKLKLEEKVKNLEQKLKENNEQPLTVMSPSGKARAMPLSVPSETVTLFLTESHCTLSGFFFTGDAVTLLQEEIAREKQVLDVHMSMLNQQWGCRGGEYSKDSPYWVLSVRILMGRFIL